MSKGKFIISIDYEKLWGFNDSFEKLPYDNLNSIDNKISEILNIFKKYNITATWAVVTAMLISSRELLSINQKSIENQKFISYLKSKNVDEKLYKCSLKNLIEAKQHIASHTHFHKYYDNNNKMDYLYDILESSRVLKNNGIDCDTIIFPRNIIPNEILSDLYEHKFRFYRGLNNIIDDSKSDKNTFLIKVFRLLESYIPFVNFNSQPYIDESKLINVPPSRFLRLTKFNFLNKLHLFKIKREMYHAAVKNKHYHLWFHPHNFLISNDSIYILDEICSYYNELNLKYDFNSIPMKDIEIND